MQAPCFSLTLPSEPHMLSVARTFVEAVCQACRLDRSLTHALVLVTGEAFTNVVRHAHRDRPGSQIDIQLQIEPEAVTVTVLDQGAPFDIAQVPHLDPGELRLGGRGVYLMRTLMDEISCAPRGAGQDGNILCLRKRLPTVLRDCG